MEDQTSHETPRLLHTGKRLGTSAKIARYRVREWCAFDAGVLKRPVEWLGVGVSLLLRPWAASKFDTILGKIHSSSVSVAVQTAVERTMKAKISRGETWGPLVPNAANDVFLNNPARMLQSLAIVLKSPGVNERGVLLLKYSFAFLLFEHLFDLKRILDRYYLVLEPSWSGYCTPEILNFTRYDQPIFVQTPEPRDIAFLRRLGNNLIPIPIGANWWVDHRTFQPLEGIPKDVDLVVNSGWARFKRHERIFHALRTLRRHGQTLKVILIGYPMEIAKQEVLRMANHYGVGSQLEIYEKIPQADVNLCFNRAKVNVVWSRREGINRAIVEGMFAGTPGLQREGFNYGYQHDYINCQTGMYVREHKFPETLSWMIDHHSEFSPRQWVMDHMSCHRSAEILNEEIRRSAIARGEEWTRPLTTKINELNGMKSWEKDHIFEDDYKFLLGCLSGFPRDSFY